MVKQLLLENLKTTDEILIENDSYKIARIRPTSLIGVIQTKSLLLMILFLKSKQI